MVLLLGAHASLLTDLMGYGWIGDTPDPLFSRSAISTRSRTFGRGRSMAAARRVPARATWR